MPPILYTISVEPNDARDGRHVLYPLINSSCRYSVENDVCIMVKHLPFCLVASWWLLDLPFPLCPFSLLLPGLFLLTTIFMCCLYIILVSLLVVWHMDPCSHCGFSPGPPHLTRLPCALCQSQNQYTPSFLCESSVPSHFSRSCHNYILYMLLVCGHLIFRFHRVPSLYCSLASFLLAAFFMCCLHIILVALLVVWHMDTVVTLV